MRIAAGTLVLSGLAAAASCQTASVFLTTSATLPFAGESFTVSVSATGSSSIFGYNLMVFAQEGSEYMTFSDLVHNPTGSSNFFGAPAGPGIVGHTVDTRDASAGILISPLPLDNLPFFTFTVTMSDDYALQILRFGVDVGSGPTAAVQYPDSSVPPIIFGQDYPEISFNSLRLGVPSPGGVSPLLLAGWMAAGRRRRAAHSQEPVVS